MRIIKDILHSIHSLLKIVYKGNLKSLSQFTRVKPERILYILGNGKSLNDVQLSADDNVDCLVVNRHVLSDSYVAIEPKHYVLADPHFFQHPEGIDVLKRINNVTSWNLTLYVPYAKFVKGIVNENITNQNIKIVYYNTYSFKGFKSIKYFLYKTQLSMPVVQNVLVAAIMIGILSQYKRIKLYGVEHTWTKYLFVEKDNVVYLENPHFFDKDKVGAKPVKEIQHTDEYPFYLILENYSRMFKSYWEIKEWIKDDNINIQVVNKTPGSFIDAFFKDY